MPTTLLKHKTLAKTPNRIFHHIKGDKEGSIMVFFAGIHGNEFAGVEALNRALKSINSSSVKGEIYGVYGNIKALQKKKRYIQSDLNRLWTSKQLKALIQKEDLTDEEIEQEDLLNFINQLLQTTHKPIYFIDLHTTSSKSLPFITINDAIINRKFSNCFPLPVVLGIEEYLEGPLLSYLNTLGYVSLGFEGGQHEDPQAVKSCEAFVLLALVCSGILKSLNIETFEQCKNTLKKASNNENSIFEVIFKYHIKKNENFLMQPHFKSFQNIKKGTFLATSNGKRIFSQYTAQLFMPLYQKSGDDGFFIVRSISPFFLKLSALLRKIKADNLLTLLPGISWENKDLGILKANLNVTRYLAKSIFHLFGYRNKQIDKTHLLLYNRERVAKRQLYQHEKWYKKTTTY